MPRPNRFVPGAKHGRLTAITELNDGLALYRCECGASKITRRQHVLSGRVQSCGCLQKERATATLIARNSTHGKFGTPIYAVWNSMISRCYNPNSQAYANYGGRGIGVCSDWRDFANFYADMNDPQRGLTLDRIDNSKGYSPENCRWVNMTTQQNNKRSNVVLEYRGKFMTATEWATHLGINRMMIYDRLKAGWSVERTLTTPKRGR